MRLFLKRSPYQLRLEFYRVNYTFGIRFGQAWGASFLDINEVLILLIEAFGVAKSLP